MHAVELNDDATRRMGWTVDEDFLRLITSTMERTRRTSEGGGGWMDGCRLCCGEAIG